MVESSPRSKRAAPPRHGPKHVLTHDPIPAGAPLPLPLPTRRAEGEARMKILSEKPAARLVVPVEPRRKLLSELPRPPQLRIPAAPRTKLAESAAEDSRRRKTKSEGKRRRRPVAPSAEPNAPAKKRNGWLPSRWKPNEPSVAGSGSKGRRPRQIPRLAVLSGTTRGAAVISFTKTRMRATKRRSAAGAEMPVVLPKRPRPGKIGTHDEGLSLPTIMSTPVSPATKQGRGHTRGHHPGSKNIPTPPLRQITRRRKRSNLPLWWLMMRRPAGRPAEQGVDQGMPNKGVGVVLCLALMVGASAAAVEV